MRKRFWPILIACSLWRSAGAQAGSIADPGPPRLLSEIVLQTDSIHLSDLLPHDTDLALRSAAERISLGRGPEPGSIRVFTPQELRREISGTVRIEIPEQVTVRGGGHPVSQKRVQQAAYALVGGMDWSQAQIITPELAIRTRDAELRATGIRPGPNPRMLMVKMECRARRDCAPFWAHATFPRPVESRFLSSPANPTAKHLQSPAVALVSPGRPAFLLCNNGAMRITMRVLPLKRAGLGQAVQVFDPASRRWFSARVSGPDLVESRLQEMK